MPRKPIDYSKALFYRLLCRDTTVKDCYVGSTTNETNRRANHKTHCTNQNDPKHNYFVYRFIRDHGGWQNWELIVHEKSPMNNEYECKIRERFWCEEYKAELNKQVPSRTDKQYHDDHKQIYNKRSAAWNLANEARMKTKHACACGGCYTTNGKSTHLKTKKHIAYLTTLPK